MTADEMLQKELERGVTEALLSKAAMDKAMVREVPEGMTPKEAIVAASFWVGYSHAMASAIDLRDAESELEEAKAYIGVLLQYWRSERKEANGQD